MKDLEGLMVVSIEQAVAAPYASGKMADAGARVIKIERPEGDFARLYDADAKGLSSYFTWLNRGKESIALDLKYQDDVALVKKMIGQADVFIQNLMPGAIDRLGLSMAELRRQYPRLITLSISGYGSTGEYSQMKAYDLLIQAETGLASLTGGPSEPGRVGVSICDIGAGMTAYQAILQALLGREKTGQGRHIEVSLFSALADWMNIPYIQRHYGGKNIPRPGLHHPTIAPYGVFPCGDGGLILLSIQNEREWQRLATEVLGRPDMITDDRFSSNIARVQNRDALNVIMHDVFGQYDRDDMAKKLFAASIAYGKLNSVDDLINHPQTQYITTMTSAGEVRMIAPGALFDGKPMVAERVPDLGEHSDALRAEFTKAE
jgi:crotonobetainyl-CoA:carnitine CoA-transferase CaiB-like acyl-CoA transferase